MLLEGDGGEGRQRAFAVWLETQTYITGVHQRGSLKWYLYFCLDFEECNHMVIHVISIINQVLRYSYIKMSFFF